MRGRRRGTRSIFVERATFPCPVYTPAPGRVVTSRQRYLTERSDRLENRSNRVSGVCVQSARPFLSRISKSYRGSQRVHKSCVLDPEGLAIRPDPPYPSDPSSSPFRFNPRVLETFGFQAT